jgi:hypothetical protein
MKNLDQKNFSYRGAPSKLQSEETNDDLVGDDGMYDDAPNVNNFLIAPNLISSTRHPIFDLNAFDNGKGDFLSADDLKGKTSEEISFNGATNI